MPLYDFKCGNADCGVYFEKIVKMDTEKDTCPQCGQEAERVLLAPGSKMRVRFHFNYLAPTL